MDYNFSLCMDKETGVVQNDIIGVPPHKNSGPLSTITVKMIKISFFFSKNA